MPDNVAIRVNDVSKTFKLPHEKNTSLKSAAVNFYKRDRGFDKQETLKNISFEVKDGEFFGIVGRNGSGKTTLLKMLAGIYTPDSGTIKVQGKLTPFIELGVGFSPELSGRDNVYLNGALLGFSRRQMLDMYEDIVKFAEIERFMDQKLKNYSSGMQVRLAFSIAIRAQSDILLIDEVLAVGDAAFQKKCFDHFMLLKKNKRTVVLVTHDMGAIRQYCDRAIMINDGKVIKSGSPDKVAQSYQRLFADEMQKEESTVKIDEQSKHWGSGKMVCLKPEVKVSKDSISIKTHYKALTNVSPSVFGFTIFGPSGNTILENNTLRIRFKTSDLKKGDRVNLSWDVPNILVTGKYSVSVACCDMSTTDYYDWYNEAVSFDIFKDSSTSGLVDPQVRLIEDKNRVNVN